MVLFPLVGYDRSYCNEYSYVCLHVHLCEMFSGVVVSAVAGDCNPSHPCLSLTLRDSYSFFLGRGLGTSTKDKTNKKLPRQLECILIIENPFLSQECGCWVMEYASFRIRCIYSQMGLPVTTYVRPT